MSSDLCLDTASPAHVSGGLSQADLDALSVGVADSEPTSPEGPAGLLRQLRRTRRFGGAEAAQALAADAAAKASRAPMNVSDATNEASMRPSFGLSQESLDALSITANEDVEEILSPKCSEAFLLSVRRRRHFMGNEAADALIMDAMSKGSEVASQDKDASDETTTTASGSVSLPSRGFSQETLDALSVRANEAGSNESSDSFLLRARRRRHFAPEEAADAMYDAKVLEAISQETECSNMRSAASSSPSPVPGGLSQDELDAMCICAPEEAADPCLSEGPGSLLLGLRRRRAFVCAEAADDWAAFAKVRHDLADSEGSDASTATGSFSGGLSQRELDSLSVSACDQDLDDEHESGQPDASARPEELCWRSRRMRCFAGQAVADAFASETLSQVRHDSMLQESVADQTTVAPSVTVSSGGLSQEELDALGISATESCSPKAAGKAQKPSISSRPASPDPRLEQVATPQRKARGVAFRMLSSPGQESAVNSP